MAPGLIGARALTRFLTSWLCGVRPADPLTLLAVTLLPGGIALLATNCRHLGEVYVKLRLADRPPGIASSASFDGAVRRGSPDPFGPTEVTSWSAPLRLRIRPQNWW